MKSLYLIVFTVIFSIASVSAQTAEKVKWYTLEEALALNAKNPRNILIDVYTDWCSWCKVMDKETFNNPTIAKYINANFYPVKFNAESKSPLTFAGQTFVNQDKTHQFAVALIRQGDGRVSYPSVAYLTGELKLIGAIPGFYKPEKIEPLLHFIVEEKYKDNISLEDYEKTFVSELKK